MDAIYKETGSAIQFFSFRKADRGQATTAPKLISYSFNKHAF
jgi:hypothetical protein